MKAIMRTKSMLTGMTLLFAATAVWAQQQSARVIGSIEGVDGPTLVVKTDKGEMKVGLTDKVQVYAVEKMTLNDVKKGDYVGVGAMPQADGSQRAIQVSIFAESQRGQGEGHRPWSRDPKGTMTNATVDTTIASVDGQVLMVKYRDGEKKIIVTPEALVLRYSLADKAELRPGAKIAINNAAPKPDGSFEASRINVGRDGYAPQ